MTTTQPTTAPTTDPPTAGSRPLPLWASVPIILACLSAGGWILHWYVGTHLKADEAHLLGDVPPPPPAAPPRQGNARGGGRGLLGMFAGSPRNIAPARNASPARETFDAYTEHARATFALPAGRPATVSLTYGPQGAYGFVPDDVRRTMFAAHQLATDSRYATALKLTPEQQRQLQQRSRTGMVVSPADRQLLVADFAAWHRAPAKDQPPAKAKLLDDLEAVSQRSREPTRQAFADAAARINALVTPAQWKQFKAMGGQP